MCTNVVPREAGHDVAESARNGASEGGLAKASGRWFSRLATTFQVPDVHVPNAVLDGVHDQELRTIGRESVPSAKHQTLQFVQSHEVVLRVRVLLMQLARGTGEPGMLCDPPQDRWVQRQNACLLPSLPPWRVHSKRKQRRRVWRHYPWISITLQTGHRLLGLLGVLACLVLVAFHVGRRYSGKNREIEVKILKETLETALWCKERSRSNDETVRNKWWSNDETADHMDDLKVTRDKKLSVRRVLPRDAGCAHLNKALPQLQLNKEGVQTLTLLSERTPLMPGEAAARELITGTGPRKCSSQRGQRQL